MSQANPFDSLPAAAVSPSLSEWPALPRRLAWVALAVGVIGIVITLITWGRIDEVDYASLLRQSVSAWAGYLLLSALAAYWVILVYLERNGLADYPQPGWLMLAYGLVWLLVSWGLGYALSFLSIWLYEKTGYNGIGRLLNDCLWWLIGLLRFAVETLLTLWLVLHLFRHKARPTEDTLRVSATALAWCFALGVVVVSLQLHGLSLRLVKAVAPSSVSDGWQMLALLLNAGLCLVVSFFAARSALPAQVRGFRGGRLALACLITFALWLGSAVLLSVLMVLTSFVFGVAGGLVLMLLLALLQLALLWPFTCLGLRWGYRAQAA
ncbi:hypothetical protein ACSVIJ_17915 [Pseudomonas sp. NCHU5208]|uniref:hypothetical protein n=1 Tax=unclassified Pseudomonas TaxID=196821 RepID=UPI003F9DD75E